MSVRSKAYFNSFLVSYSSAPLFPYSHIFSTILILLQVVVIGQRKNMESKNRNGNTETSLFSLSIDTAIDGMSLSASQY